MGTTHRIWVTGGRVACRLRLLVAMALFGLLGSAASASATTLTWTGMSGVNQNWNTPGNWSGGTGTQVPTSSDDVVINSGSPQVTGSDANARSLSLNTGAPASGGLTISDHTLTVSSSGTSTLDGFLEVDGTLDLGDPTTYEGSTDSNGINVVGTVNISSTFTMTGTDGGGTGTNAQINAGLTSLVHVLSGGSIVRSTSSGIQTIGPRLDDDGSVSVQTGTLDLHEGDAGSTTGNYAVSSGATLEASGSASTFEAPSITGQGTMDVGGGTTTIGASDTFTVPALHLDGGGTLTLNRDLSIPTLVATNGHRNGTGTLTVTSTADFSGLQLDTGTTTVAASVPSFAIGAFLTVGSTTSGTNATLNLDTPTTYTQSANSNGINLGGGVLNIASTFTMSGAGIQDGINDTGGSPLVHILSTGSLVRDTSTGTAAIGPPVNNDGSVSVQTGTLQAAGGLTQAIGAATVVASGAELDGPVTLNGGTLQGNGTLGGPVTNVAGTVAPGSSPGTLTIMGNYTQGVGGMLAEDITGTTPGTQFDQLLVGGVVALDGTLAINSAGFTPATGNTFKIISGASSRTGTFATVTGTTVNGATYTPQYDIDGVTLTVSVAPPPPNQTLTVAFAGTGAGTVSDGAAVNCAAGCQHQYPQGTVVTLTATPAAGSTFVGWSGGGCSGTGTCAATMSSDQAVTATFTLNPAPQQTLIVSLAGTGSGSVSSSPAGISCPGTCSHVYAQATIVTLTATPAPGSTFAGWSGGGCSGTGSCQVTMSAPESVIATFATVPPVTHTVTVTRVGTGSGTVTSSPAGISCAANCSATFTQGITLTLTATAANGSLFAGWTGACSGTGPCTLSITQDLKATATFDLAPVLVKPPVVSSGDLFCGVQHRGRCHGLKLRTTFSGPGNAVWQFAAYNTSPRHATSDAAAAKLIQLGSIKRTITKAGTVTIVFKLPPSARTNKLYKQVVKLKLKAIRITITFTTPSGKRLVETKTIPLRS